MALASSCSIWILAARLNVAAGFDTVLVLTGIDTRETAAAAPGPDRPTWVRAHLPALLAGGAEGSADPRRG